MNSDLYDAIIKDDIDALKDLESRLRVGDQLTPTNSTVLHLACQYGSIKCVKEILTVHKSLLLKINSRGETALYLAAREGHYDVVVALIDAAKLLLIQPNHLQNTSSTIVENLIRTHDVELETALHAAVRYNHNNVVQLLVTEDPSHLHPPNKHLETPLYLACIRCHTSTVRTILDNCKSPAFGGPNGRTALHAAVLHDGGRECVKLLLEKNKDIIKVADNYGWTAFHYVACSKLYTIVEDLVGADKSVGYVADEEYKRTALHVAAYEGNIRVMKKLVEYYPDSWEIVDGRGRNILHISVEKDRKEVIRFILSQGCKARNNLLIQRDEEGNTPLHLIAKLGCFVEELMDLRALDWQVLNHQKLTPLDVLHDKQTRNVAEQRKIKSRLKEANAKKQLLVWPTQVQDVESGNRVVMHNGRNNTEITQQYRSMINTHMIVAALITTVSLTAGFTMPGGFDGNQGSLTQGSAILLRKTAFKAFIVTDTLAMLFSISSLFLYFVTTFYDDNRKLEILLKQSAQLNIVSIIAMVLAFITGTYAVLSHSSTLAITVCVISSFFFCLFFYYFEEIPILEYGAV